MNERRSLLDGMNSKPSSVDSTKEVAFVYRDKPGQSASLTDTINRVPISTRMREDYSKALKRASLERQLHGIQPNTLIDILEQALEPWLKTNGYIT